MSYEKLGFVKGQTLKAEHLNHIEDGIANAGGVSSWNELADKPFYSEMVEGNATFDGDLTGKEYYDMGGGGIVVKMSDTPVTMEALIGSTVVVKHNVEELGATGDVSLEFTVTEDFVEQESLDDSRYGLAVASEFGIPVVYVIKGDLSDMGLPLTEGTYYINMQMDGQYLYCHSISCLDGMQEVVHKIDEKYLPEVGLKADEVSAIATTIVDEAINGVIEDQIPTMINEAIAGAIGGSY